ncbi:TldD/PmbA family protein [bacterium]|nr:TldD/PmbA family protein [bacterium]
MELLGKLQGRVDSGEVIYLEKSARGVSFKGWKIRGSESTQERGYAVRVIVDGKVGTAATTDENAVDEMVDNAIEAAKFGEEIELEFPSKSEQYAEPKIMDSKVESVDIPKLADIGNELISRIEQYRSDCDNDVDISTSQVKLKITNTNGFENEYEKTAFSLSGSLVRVKDNDIYMAWDFYVSTHFPDSRNEAIDPIVKRLDEIMQYANAIVPAPSGQVPIVFSPFGAAVLLLPLSVGLNGNNIYTKTSPVFDKLGQKLFDEKLTVSDDGTIDGKVSSTPFDDEGIPKKPMPLIQNGVLKNFLFDLTTAKKSGYETNGCASRSLFSPPSPDTSNVIIGNGEHSIDDIIADIKEGIIVESVLGMGQGNVLSGAFSNPVATGFKIENGKIVGRVKNVAIAGNIYENMKDIAAISSERKWVYGAYYIPYIRMDNLSVVGK